jgi:hypothetical protein
VKVAASFSPAVVRPMTIASLMDSLTVLFQSATKLPAMASLDWKWK